MTVAQGFSLRERKFAKTRLTLAEIMTAQLEHASLDELSVKALCERAQISEATFFNYFPKKQDLIVYLDTLWTLELNWYGHQAALEARGLAVIDALFRYAAIQVQKKPGLMGEIIAAQAQRRERVQRPDITAAERAMAFSDLPGIGDIPADNLETILRTALQQAMDKGELPENTLVPAAMLGLVSVFYGVPLALMQVNPAGITPMYRQQLAVLWAGLRMVAGQG